MIYLAFILCFFSQQYAVPQRERPAHCQKAVECGLLCEMRSSLLLCGNQLHLQTILRGLLWFSLVLFDIAASCMYMSLINEHSRL